MSPYCELLPLTSFLGGGRVGAYLWHMEVPRIGVELELQLPDYITAMATPDLSCICNLPHSLRQIRSSSH